MSSLPRHIRLQAAAREAEAPDSDDVALTARFHVPLQAVRDEVAFRACERIAARHGGWKNYGQR